MKTCSTHNLPRRKIYNSVIQRNPGEQARPSRFRDAKLLVLEASRFFLNGSKMDLVTLNI